MRDPERGRDTSRGRRRLPAGSPMWDSIPGPQDHALSFSIFKVMLPAFLLSNWGLEKWHGLFMNIQRTNLVGTL